MEAKKVWAIKMYRGESIKHLDGIVLNNTKRQTGKKSNVSHFPTAEIECFRLYNLMVHKQ